jgi:hypothetical protein
MVLAALRGAKIPPRPTWSALRASKPEAYKDRLDILDQTLKAVVGDTTGQDGAQGNDGESLDHGCPQALVDSHPFY